MLSTVSFFFLKALYEQGEKLFEAIVRVRLISLIHLNTLVQSAFPSHHDLPGRWKVLPSALKGFFPFLVGGRIVQNAHTEASSANN